VIGPHPDLSQGYKYKLILGYRRYKAHQLLGLKDIKAIVDGNEWDEERARILNMTENLLRQNLNILEEALTLAKLKEQGLGQFEIADEIGQSRGWVQVRTMLLEMPKEVQYEAALGYFTEVMIRDLYTIYKNEGKVKCFQAVRQVKDAKRRGEKIQIVKRKSHPFQKRVRKRNEVNQLNETLMDLFGPCLASRCLAWASGEISDFEVHQSLKRYAEKLDKEYEIPFTPEEIDAPMNKGGKSAL
jgi:ParB/RepB/Spo0J family partition protein